MTYSETRSGFEFNEPLIFERSTSGRCGVDLPPATKVSAHDIAHMLGVHASTENNLLLPEVSEPESCMHYVRLSQKNFSIDTNAYPLGSCTMKYNPKINEWAGRLDAFANLHPYMPADYLQGALSIMWDLQNWLSEIGGFAKTSLQPAAGAHGEFLGILMIHTALVARNEGRHKMLVPLSAHGTNPATAASFGYEVTPVLANAQGHIDIADLKSKMDRDCAGIMITNPSTLGIFETDIQEICAIVHSYGGYVYGDGANLNALMGKTRPGDAGIDVMHFNLHKTFTTPHGGGGPGCGAVGAAESLAQFLPAPLAAKSSSGEYYFDYDLPHAVGRIRSFYGNFGMMIRAWTYIREMGCDGLKRASELAVLNANYIKARLRGVYHLPYETDCLHEVVFSDKYQKKFGVSTLDIAKRLIDYGIHPPTIYFPLVVHGSMMFEPTETMSKQAIDVMCDAMIAISQECESNPELVKTAPHTTAIKRLNEAQAARNPILTYSAPQPSSKPLAVEEKFSEARH